MNALAMFGTDYLELLGFPPGSAASRPELAEAPMGLNGLVFKSTNVDETFAHLQSLGVAGDPPKAFSRPVTLSNGETSDAKFRTVTVRPDAFPAGRFYFCEHLTPELVWRPEWQSHVNQASQFIDLTIVSTTARETATLIAGIVESEAAAQGDTIVVQTKGDFRVLVQSPEAYAATFADAAADVNGRSAAMGAVTIKGVAPAGLDGRFKVASAEGGTHVLVPSCNALLTFRGA